MWERLSPPHRGCIRRERPSTPSAHIACPVGLSPRTGLSFSGKRLWGYRSTQMGPGLSGRPVFHSFSILAAYRIILFENDAGRIGTGSSPSPMGADRSPAIPRPGLTVDREETPDSSGS